MYRFLIFAILLFSVYLEAIEQSYNLDEFKYKKDTKIISYVDDELYAKPDKNSKKIAVIKGIHHLYIESCNAQDWCSLKYSIGFINIKKAQKYDFKYKKDSKVVTKTIDTVIYNKPGKGRKKIGVMDGNNPLYVESCTQNNWCKLKYGIGFVHLQEIVKVEEIFPVQIESVPQDKLYIKPPTKKEIILSKYATALKYFKNKNYNKSYKLFDELFEKNLNDVNINFYLGRSAYELKIYSEAIQAYERILFDKPNSTRVKYEMAKAYFFDSSYKSAKEVFLDIQDDEDVPPAVLKNVKNYLTIIEGKVSKHTFGGILMLSLNYDSNLNSRSKYDVFNNVYIPNFDIFVDMNNTTEEVGAFFHQEIAILNYGYKISDDLLFKNDFMLFSKKMFESKYKSSDIILLSYNPSLSFKHNKQLTVDYGLFVSDMWIGLENYLLSYGLFPKINYIHDSHITLKTHLKLQLNSYQTSPKKTSTYTEFNIGGNYIYSKDLSSTSSFMYINEKVNSGDSTGVDKQSYTFNLSSTYIYKPYLTFTPSTRFKQTNYDDINTLYLKKQKNTEFNLGLLGTYIFTPKWILQSGVNYLNQDSNIPTSSYDKYTININIIRPL